MAVVTVNYFSHALTRNTDFTVVLPIEPPPFPIPGIPVPDINKPFRTIYLLHGFCGNHSDWVQGTRLVEYCKMYNIAVVCPSGENSFYIDDTKRDAFYERMVSKELVETTRRMFPLSAERNDTMISGLSMGGYGAIYNGLRNPDVFGSIAAFSSALIIDEVAAGIGENPMASRAYYEHTFGDPATVPGSDVDPKALASKLVTSGADKPKLFMACGTEDFLITPNRSLHGHLTDIGYAHEYFESPGMHAWDFWDEYIQKAMRWFNEG